MRGRAIVLGVVLLSACDKAPAEPPANQVSSAAATRSSAATGSAQPGRPGPRCSRDWATVAPPASSLKGPDPRCPRDPDTAPPLVPIGHVSFPDAPSAPRLETELMLTDAHRERGLMYRKQLREDAGMLFAWGQPEVHTFWMHNTCISLDMLFIDSEGYVAGIVENAPTLDDGPRSIDCPASYVLEVNAGWARRHGVAPKQRVVIEGVP